MVRTLNMEQKTENTTPEALQILQKVARRVQSHSSGAVEAAKGSQGSLRELQRAPQRGPKMGQKRSLGTNTGPQKNEK